MLSTSVSYRQIATNIDRSLALKAAERPVALETANYLKKIGNIKSIADFLKDTRVFTFAMKAFGLEEMAHAKGFIKKVLTEGVADSNSFANRLNDDRFVALAKTFDFAAKGEETTASTAARQGVVDRYVRQTLEVAAGEENEGVRLALYFQRAAPTVKTAYGLLGDAALWKVVKTVFGFPDEMANADIDKQAAAVLKRLDIADLQDPTKLNRLIQRFTTVWDATEASAADPILNLFAGNSPSVGFELLMTLRNLKHGGA
jgi:hypothetical protein